jgi:hypothetical protein
LLLKKRWSHKKHLTTYLEGVRRSMHQIKIDENPLETKASLH